MAKEKQYIGKMLIAALAAFVIFSVVGGVLCIWFNEAARPAVRTIRNGVAWTKMFAIFFYGGSLFSLAYTYLSTYLGAYKRANKVVNWIINLLLTTFVGIIGAVIFYIVAPSKDLSVSFTASILIFLQGFGIFFIASFFAPKHWGIYNPLVK